MTKAALHGGIVRAGIELGAELGEEGLTMRAIAARMGISVTNIYQHFESKVAILREIRFHGIAMLQHALEEAAVDGEHAKQLRAMARAYIGFARNNPWLYKLLFDAEELDWSTMPAEEREVALAPMATVAAVFRDGVERWHFRDDLDVAQAVLMTWASLHGVASLIIRGRMSDAHPAFPVRDVDSFVDAFIANLVRGFSM